MCCLLVLWLWLVVVDCCFCLLCLFDVVFVVVIFCFRVVCCVMFVVDCLFDVCCLLFVEFWLLVVVVLFVVGWMFFGISCLLCFVCLCVSFHVLFLSLVLLLSLFGRSRRCNR